MPQNPAKTEEARRHGGAFLERYARDTPGALALVSEEHALSFSEWNRHANRLASALEKRGVRAKDRVAVRTMNRIEWFVTDAALAKLGAVRVAISWRLTPSEVRHILENSGARAIVFDDEDAVSLRPAWERLACAGGADAFLPVSLRGAGDGVESFGALLELGSDEPRTTAHGGGSIVYTSGTTGAPRGVTRTPASGSEHEEGLRRISEDLKRSIPYSVGDRNLLVAPLNHAAGPQSALATHARGGTVYLLRKFEPEAALSIIAQHRINVSFLVPTMLNRIVHLPSDVLARYDVSSMRIITTGASVCSADLKRKTCAYFGPCLYESYGSTETGLVTLFAPGDLAEHADSCGRVLDGVLVRIVDDEGRPLPCGEVGQIYIKSPATMSGYLGEGGPGADFTSDGYFTAGDVGRLDQQGYLYILDRKKDMIIAGGVNIYPAEIEAALRGHPAVLDAAVFGTPHAEWGEEVRAVCERVPGRNVGEEELAAFVANRLAGYKRPRVIAFTEELPRNAAGKVLKKELREPYWTGTGRAI